MAVLTRRRRLLLITGGLAAAFVAVATLAAWRWARPADTYRPGQEIAGITADLARSLPADHPKVVFTDVTAQAGITFRHFNGTRESQLPEDMGSGAAWCDFDADGWLDLVIANVAGPLSLSESERARSPARTTLYRNNGNGTFTDVTDRSGVDLRGWTMGVACADYDNDGHVDLVLTSFGTNHLFRNNGDGTFSDRSIPSGIGGPRGPVGFWTGASWGDYDRDGDLDLYVTGYVKFTRHEDAHFSGKYDSENPASINPSSFPPERNLLYRNNGDGTFTEVARAAGVADSAGRGLASTWADLDEDGWPDLYVANDLSDNVLFRNLGNGRFADVSHATRAADYRSSMGIAVGDWDGDGDQDLFLTHWIAQENALHSNQLVPASAGRNAGGPRMAFTDEADRFGLGQSSLDFVGWGTAFIDYDNDGRLDLFIANGSTLQSRGDSTRLVAMRNQLFWNRGRERGFFDVGAAAGAAMAEEHVGRGAAFGDYDNDGDVDVFVVNHGAPGRLLRNDGGNRSGWLSVELRGTRSNRQGFGASVTVVTGSLRQTRQLGSQSSYLSQNSLIETFGLGAARRVDTILVSWPSGTRDTATNVPANQRIVVSEGESARTERASITEFWATYREATAHRVGGRHQPAADAYARALAINPVHEDALYNLGNVHHEMGQFAAAAGAWRRLLRVNAGSARAHSQLAQIHACLDAGAPFQLDSAARHLERAHQINKEENGPIVRLGEVALMRGDTATASAHFQTVLATDAASVPAHFYVGYLAWKAGSTARALQEFARAMSGPVRSSPVPVAGEGDTKLGSAPLRLESGRCAQLRLLHEPVASDDPARAMSTRYRRLDSLLSQARSHAR